MAAKIEPQTQLDDDNFKEKASNRVSMLQELKNALRVDAQDGQTQHEPIDTQNASNRPASVSSVKKTKNSNHSIGQNDSGNYSSSVDLIIASSFRKEREPRQQLWLDYASIMAMSVALPNIWRLPTFVYFNYTGESLIAYIILMTTVGLPLFIIELALGQFGRSGVIKLWLAVPLLKGIGLGQLIAALYQAFYFPSLMTWAFQFGMLGMAGWEACDTVIDSNMTACLCEGDENATCNYSGQLSLQERCFQNHVLQGANESMNYLMLPMLAVVTILITLCISFGERIMKILTSVSGLITAALLITSLGLALNHPNNYVGGSNDTAAYGLSLLIPNEPWGFGRGEVWYGAMIQVLFSLSIGFGTLPSLSSSNAFTRNVIRQGIFLWSMNLLFGIASVITAFAWVGISGFHRNDVLNPGAFIYYLYYSVSDSMWAGLAFAVIFFSGLNAMLPISYAVGHNLTENFPDLLTRYWKWACCVFCIMLWLLNIPGISSEGHKVVVMWDRYAAGGTVLTFLIIHMIGWQWIYGWRELKLDLEFMLMRTISKLWPITWGFTTIAILLMAELWGFFGLPLDGTVDCRFPIWLFASGWTFYLLALAVAISITIVTIARQMDYGIVNKMRCSIKSDWCWGPSDPQINSEWRAIREGTAPIATFLLRDLSKVWRGNEGSATERSRPASPTRQKHSDVFLRRLSSFHPAVK